MTMPGICIQIVARLAELVVRAGREAAPELELTRR
jgi:hypothetical protein